MQNESNDQPTHAPDGGHVSDPKDAERTLAENKRLSASGLSWDEVEPKPNEKWNRVTDMGEAD